jgi:hypothetical protein
MIPARALDRWQQHLSGYSAMTIGRMCDERDENAQKAGRLIDGAKRCIELLGTKLAQIPDDDSAAEKLMQLSEIMTDLEALVDGIGQLVTRHARGAEDLSVSTVAALPSPSSSGPP